MQFTLKMFNLKLDDKTCRTWKEFFLVFLRYLIAEGKNLPAHTHHFHLFLVDMTASYKHDLVLGCVEDWGISVKDKILGIV